MTLDDFKKLFAYAPERFPSELAGKYPRILNQILSLWETPPEQDKYLNHLVVDMRGSRQGFPPKVLEEILFISELYSRWRQDRRRRADESKLKEISVKHLSDVELSQRAVDDDLKRKLILLKQMISRADMKSIDFMHEHGIYINQKDYDGQTPLMYAASANAEQLVLALMKENSNPHVYDISGNTALHWAVVMNRLRVSEILLFFGANPDTKNKAGATPFALACIKHDASIARRLLDYGADVLVSDHNGNFPLHKAVSAKAKETIMLLLASGASKEARNKDGISSYDLANQDPDIKAVFDKHRTDLLKASMAERLS